jgi:phage minor structural protein|nr:MAG TPA: tail protein [Caudoviricetes sp.]
MSNIVKICIFNKDTPKSTVILSNGDAILDNICTSCKVTENLEGTYELDAEFIIDDKGLWEYLQEEAILKVKVDYGDEYFRIIKPRKTRTRVIIYAVQVTIYETIHLWLNDVRPTGLNGTAAINWILDGAVGVKELEVYSNISTSNTAYYENINMYKAIHDCDQSFLNRWGGEIQRRGYLLKILDKVGKDRGVQIKSCKNLKGFEANTNVDSITTRIKPKGNNGITIDGFIDSPIINNYARAYTKEFTYNDVKVKSADDETEGFSTLEEAQAELKRLAQLEYTENKVDIISADYTIDFVDLSQTEEYKNYIKAERVYIGDKVSVFESKLNINVVVRAIERNYNVLTQKVEEIKLSNKDIGRKSINDVMIDISKEIEKNDNSIEKWIQSFINAGIKDSYVFYNKEELIVCDSPTIEEAIHVWRFNKNGLAHSANGYQGPYDIALTADGKVNANMILAGMLKGQYIDARNITVPDGNGDITFSVSSDGKVRINEGAIQLDEEGIQIFHKSQNESLVGRTVMDEEGFRILDKDGNELADIGSQGSHFANLSVDGDFRHYPTAQIIDRQPNWNADYYVAKIATGDGTGRDEENKADSLQTVFGYMKSQGCMFFNKLTINIEAGVRIREKIVLRDFHGTLIQISLGKDAVLRLKEGSAIEDNYCRIQFYGDTNTNILDDDTTSEKINKLPCIEVEGDNGIRLASSSYVQFGWMRLRGKDNNSYFANLYTGANLHVVSCDISNVKAPAYVDSTSRFTISYCRGNVEKLAYAVGGAMISKSVQVPKHINDSEIYYPAVDLSGGLAGQLIQFDTLFQDTYSNDTDTNTMRIFPAIKQYTEREGEGTDDTANLLNLVGQGKFKEGYKSLHGYATFAEMASKDTIKADTLSEFAESRESYKIYIRMTRADNNTTAPIPRVRFQLENGEYTAYYKLDPLTSPLTGDGSGTQITDYNATEDRELPAELADKLVKFGIYSIEFQGDTVEEYLIVDNIRLVIKGAAKKGDSGSIDTTEVKAIGKILANALNVRKTPGINGEYAGLLVNGDTVEIVGVDPNTGWYKIKYNGEYAYITNKSEYVEIISGDPNGSTTVQKVEVLAENLNVRSGGSTSYNSIGIVSKGFVADILETDKDTGWYKISYNGEYGWITNNTTYVKVITGTATVIPELYNGAKVAEFAESYYNARNNYTSAKSWDNGFTYGETTPCSSTASGTMGANYSIWEKSAQGNYWKMIDDSTLLLLCLMGYSYSDSPYANLVNFNNYRANIMAKNSEYTGAIVPASGTTLARTCAEIAKFFSDRGQTITVKTDYSNIQKGDLIFYAGKTSSGNYIYPNRWKCISNCAICIGQDTDGNAQLITAMSNPGEKHTDGWFVGLKKDLVKDYNTNTIVLVIRPSTKVTSGGSSSSGGITGGGSSSGGITVSNMRQTICDTAMKIVNMGTNHTAWYSQYWRTTSLNSMVTIKGKVETVGGTTYYQPSWVQTGVTYGFDCSSLVGCCYEKAGMSYMKGLTCSMGTLQSTAKAHGATFWRYADSGFTRAKAGDIIMFANDGYTVTTSNMATVRTHHTAIYMGNGYIAEASGYKKGIIYSKYNLSKQAFFIRLPELDKADSASSTGGTTVKEEYVNCFNEKGTIDGKNYIYKLHDARCTCYAATESNSSGRSGLGTHMGKTVAAQNIPYGTKIYIPGLKGQTWTNANGTKVTLDGIFTVTDSGIACFDFDIVAGSTSSACFSNYSNPQRFDVYILEWGTSTIQNYSFSDTYRIAYNNGVLSRYKSAFKNYISNGGVLINLLKFYNDDANIRSSTYWSILNS